MGNIHWFPQFCAIHQIQQKTIQIEFDMELKDKGKHITVHKVWYFMEIKGNEVAHKTTKAIYMPKQEWLLQNYFVHTTSQL